MKLQIPMFKEKSTYKKIELGYSNDEKWIVDDTYLVRITPNSLEMIKQQATLINEVQKVDARVPFVYEVGEVAGRNYMVLDYLSGENAEEALSKLEAVDQYRVGGQVGETLKNMHSIAAPADYPAWDKRWTERYNRLRSSFEGIVSDNPSYQCVLPFIDENLSLLANRPSAVQHYDFHPGNVLINGTEFSGLIDLQKITYGDPINEFYKLEYFTVQQSREFARGIVDGYHHYQSIPIKFWELHRLYAAIHIVSAEVWGHIGALEQKDKFQQYTQFTLEQFEHFQRLIPKWYIETKWT